MIAMPRKFTIKETILIFLLSIVCGTFTGGLVFLFKFLASYIIKISGILYEFTSTEILFLPLCVLSAVILSLVLCFIIEKNPVCKGAGIPNAIKMIKSAQPVKWILSVLILPLAALITFLSGVPLGNEGPSVQMGCAIGEFTSNFDKKNRKAFHKYLLSSGMGAGFASATGAPFSAILFVFEETHPKFSLRMILCVVSASISSAFTTYYLGKVFNFHTHLFDISVKEILPFKYIWIIIIFAIIIACLSFLFKKLCYFVDLILNEKFKNIPSFIKISVIFALTAILGCVSKIFIGTGHNIINDILTNEKIVYYMIVLAFFVRSLLIAFANKSGITGGLFIPTLTLGAILGYLFTKLIVFLNILPQQYALLIIIISLCSFLGSTTKIPITAFVFALEVFSLGNNFLILIISILVTYVFENIFEGKKTLRFISKFIKTTKT